MENGNGTQVYMIVAVNILISQDAESTTERDSHELGNCTEAYTISRMTMYILTMLDITHYYVLACIHSAYAETQYKYILS